MVFICLAMMEISCETMLLDLNTECYFRQKSVLNSNGKACVIVDPKN